MSKRAVLLLVLTLIVFSFLILPVHVEAMSKTIVVPDNYPTIQTAISNATEGDTVFVKKGTYYETLAIDKPISFIGENVDTTIIDANGAKATVIDVNASNVAIVGFTIKNNTGYYGSGSEPKDGIKLELNSDYNNVSNNRITLIPSGSGISLYRSSYNTIVGNNITDCEGAGIIVRGGSNNTVGNNRVTNNYFEAIIEDESSDNSIIGNYFANSTYGYGLSIERCQNNIVVSNTFAYNEYGLAVSPPSANNRFYHNNFVNNKNQVLLFGDEANWAGLLNYWDNGYPSGGNYWSDYLTKYSNATEIDSSGIGNIPVSLEANGGNSGVIYQDRYPLMKQVAIPEFPSWVIMPLFIVATLLSIVFIRRNSQKNTPLPL
jgi:parallel beta-helix repeat protein